MKIGIDIGGSHVGIGLVDEFGNIQQKKEKYIVEKIENESQISKKNLKEEITQFIIQTIKEYQKMDFVENVGIAVPGTVNQTTIIKAVNLGIENYETYYFVLFKFTHVIFHAYPLENKCKIKNQVEQNQYYHVHRNKSKIKK